MSTSTASTSASECEEAVLLRDWDFERFFPNSNRSSMETASNSNTPPHQRSKQNLLKSSAGIDKTKIDEINRNLKLEERVKHEMLANNAKAKNSFLFNNLMKSESSKAVHKRQDSDSKLSLNFVRGFRRENSDFFPLSKRHSAVLGERSSNTPASAQQITQRSSAIFQRNRNKGEPILTDFVVKSSSNDVGGNKGSVSGGQLQQQQTPIRNLDFIRPRREKTESVILIRNSATRQLLFDQQVMMVTLKMKERKNN